MPSRPADSDYYLENRTQHVALGDIFREIPLFPGLELGTFGMLLNYTSSMLVGAEGTNREYAHPFRVIAPIFELEHIHEHDQRWTTQKIEQLRKADDFGGWMYLPQHVGEYREAAVALFRPTLALHDDIQNRRVTQLTFEASRQLCVKLAKVYAGVTPDLPADHPNMEDHWEGAP
jgi:hypothetical protein